MKTWIKPNGNEITINEEVETVKYAESLGWKPKEEPSVPIKDMNVDELKEACKSNGIEYSNKETAIKDLEALEAE